MKKCQLLVNVSIRRQGRVLFWLKLLLLSCERLCKPSHSQHSSANTFSIAGFPQPDKQLFCAQSHWTAAPWNSSWNQHAKGLSWQPCCSRGAQNPLVPGPTSAEHEELLPAQTPSCSRLQPRAVPVCSENVSLHSINFVNRARSSCTKYCNDSD